MYDLLGFCGIDCGKCEIRRAANDRQFALKLIEEWRKSDPKVDETWFVCQGCKGADDVCWGEACAIRKCAVGKGVEHCGRCRDFKCGLILQFESDEHRHHTAAVRYLEKLSKSTEV